MEITEVRVFLKDSKEGKLRAYTSITLDNCFIIRDLKVIEGKKGLFVAMPSRKLRKSCTKCGHPNVLGSKFCNNCGGQIEADFHRDAASDGRSNGEVRQDTHKDIAHPISVEMRDYVQKKVLDAYEQEKAKVNAGSDLNT